MSSWIPSLTKIESVKEFSVRQEGLPKCPVCESERLDEELYGENSNAFIDISFCENCGNYVEIVTPKSQQEKEKL